MNSPSESNPCRVGQAILSAAAFQAARRCVALAALLLLPHLATAQEPQPAAAPQPAPAKEAPKIEIPAVAVKSADGFYRYTGPTGKKWIYRKTPFGIARTEDKPAESSEDVKVTEDGDSIRFERPSPFGAYKWERKKTELNEMERAAWDREKARAAKQDIAK